MCAILMLGTIATTMSAWLLCWKWSTTEIIPGQEWTYRVNVHQVTLLLVRLSIEYGWRVDDMLQWSQQVSGQSHKFWSFRNLMTSVQLWCGFKVRTSIEHSVDKNQTKMLVQWMHSKKLHSCHAEKESTQIIIKNFDLSVCEVSIKN